MACILLVASACSHETALQNAIPCGLALTARITFAGNALPHCVFFCVGHKNPVRNLAHCAAATAAHVVKQRGADGDAGGIRTRGRRFVHRRDNSEEGAIVPAPAHDAHQRQPHRNCVAQARGRTGCTTFYPGKLIRCVASASGSPMPPLPWIRSGKLHRKRPREGSCRLRNAASRSAGGTCTA